MLSQLCRDFTRISRLLSICAAYRRAPTSSPRLMRETQPRISTHLLSVDLFVLLRKKDAGMIQFTEIGLLIAGAVDAIGESVCWPQALCGGSA